MAPALGFSERPLGTARWNYVNSGNLYRAILDAEPYKVRGLIGIRRQPAVEAGEIENEVGVRARFPGTLLNVNQRGVSAKLGKLISPVFAGRRSLA